MARPNTQAERITRLEAEQDAMGQRLEKGDNGFEKIKAMMTDLEDKLKSEIDEIKNQLVDLKTQLAGLKPIVEIITSKWVLFWIAFALIFTGVGLTLSVMLSVDVTSQIKSIREVTQ